MRGQLYIYHVSGGTEILFLNREVIESVIFVSLPKYALRSKFNLIGITILSFCFILMRILEATIKLTMLNKILII